MSPFLYIKEIWRGKDLYRIFMNTECSGQVLKGRTADIGSGTAKASYHRFFRKEKDAEVAALDRQISSIDFEKNPLPYDDACIDTLLVFNVLEHIYNYPFLVSEVKRVLKPGGRVLGAVPFLVGYHPDPRDFWRYTSETLYKIFETGSFKSVQIKILGRGPFVAGYSQVEFLLPRLAKFVLVPGLFLLDWIFYKIRPQTDRQKFALGLFFILTKS